MEGGAFRVVVVLMQQKASPGVLMEIWTLAAENMVALLSPEGGVRVGEESGEREQELVGNSKFRKPRLGGCLEMDAGLGPPWPRQPGCCGPCRERTQGSGGDEPQFLAAARLWCCPRGVGQGPTAPGREGP